MSKSNKKNKKKDKKSTGQGSNAVFVMSGVPPVDATLKRPNAKFVRDAAGIVRLIATERLKKDSAIVACDSPLRALFEEQNNMENGTMERNGIITKFNQ